MKAPRVGVRVALGKQWLGNLVQVGDPLSEVEMWEKVAKTEDTAYV